MRRLPPRCSTIARMLQQISGDTAGRLADFDQALAIDPAHTATYICRGNLRKETGDLDGALADFDAALAQNPLVSLAAAYHGRGGVRVLRNDFAGAIADYDRAWPSSRSNSICIFRAAMPATINATRAACLISAWPSASIQMARRAKSSAPSATTFAVTPRECSTIAPSICASMTGT